MHDPMVVAFEVRRPWPKVRRMRYEARRGFHGAFWRFGRTELYWPGLITVWHVEPDGRDSGEVCKPGTWKRHPHHWRIQVAPWQHFRRWAFTRCEWCGGRSRRHDVVNVGFGWDGSSKPKHWWMSEVGLYHGDCASVFQAHRTCVCSLIEGSWPRTAFDGEPYGKCATCDGFRRMGSGRSDDFDVHTQTTEMMRAIPPGRRDDAVIGEVRRLWREHRAHQPTDPASSTPTEGTE